MRTIYVVVIGLTLLSYSCHEKKQKEETKIVPAELTYIKRGTESFVDSSMVSMYIDYQTTSGQHLSNAASRNTPTNMPYEKVVWDTGEVFYRTLRYCKVGDSVQFSLTAKQVYFDVFGEDEYPEGFGLTAESQVNFFIGIKSQEKTSVFNARKDSLEQKRYQDYVDNTEERNRIQGIKIDKYLSDSGLVAQTTKSGLRYAMIQKGNGIIASEGDLVSVHFKGSLLDGYVFGSSYEDEQFPFEFSLGKGEVLQAWEEAASILPEGSKAIIMMPSDIGMGFRSYSDIPSNSILKYEFEIVKVVRNTITK